MYIKKFSTALVFFSIASFSSAYGMDTPDDLKNIRSWLSVRLHDSAEEIQKLIDEERLITIQNNPGNWENDYGFSFPGVNDVQKSCLIEICDLYSAQNIRPSTLDSGAGHGLMSRKMIIAGGHVTAIEQQIPTAQVLQQKVMQAKPFLAPTEKVRDVCVLRTGDVCNYNIDIYKTSYKVTWSGHIIHLFPPDQVMAYVKNLFKITECGGCAFASVHSGCGEEGLIQYFLERKKAQERFPGFFVMNRIHHYQNDAKRNVDICTKVERVGPFNPAPSDMSPTKIVDGFYQDNTEPKYDIKKPLNSPITYKMKCHSATHVFDPESLSYFFKEAGFEIEDAFFIDNLGKKVHGDLTEKEMVTDKFAVGIIARKPESIEGKITHNPESIEGKK